MHFSVKLTWKMKHLFRCRNETWTTFFRIKMVSSLCARLWYIKQYISNIRRVFLIFHRMPERRVLVNIVRQFFHSHTFFFSISWISFSCLFFWYYFTRYCVVFARRISSSYNSVLLVQWTKRTNGRHISQKLKDILNKKK